MIIYLYVKTHKTGRKYLGKTTKDPFQYNGSGKEWKKLLKEHGIEHSTEIIKICHSNSELNQWGRYYSDLWNVALDPNWMNLIPETGGGGLGQCFSDDHRKRISKALTGKKKSAEHREKIGNIHRGSKKPRNQEHMQNWIESSKRNWQNNTERKKQVAEMGKANKGRKHSVETLEKKRQAMKLYWANKKSSLTLP